MSPVPQASKKNPYNHGWQIGKVRDKSELKLNRTENERKRRKSFLFSVRFKKKHITWIMEESHFFQFRMSQTIFLHPN